MTTARLDIRLDAEIKRKAEKATALLGFKSLTEYLIKLMEDNATQVIADHENLTLKNDVFDSFMVACEKAQKPNDKLLKAVNFTKQQGFK